MKIATVGYDYYLSPERRMDIMVEVINENADADLILFPGHSLEQEEDAIWVSKNVNNKHSKVILELHNFENSVCHIKNALFAIENGKLKNLYSGQLFSTNEDIKGKDVLMNKFFDELPRKSFDLCGKRCVILQCGENSMLESKKADGYKARFRFEDNLDLNRRFMEMLDSTDIFLNPVHSIQGEQGVQHQRRVLLSGSKRHYFSTCALDYKTSGNLGHKSLQYSYFNGEEIDADYVNDEAGDYVVNVFEI